MPYGPLRVRHERGHPSARHRADSWVHLDGALELPFTVNQRLAVVQPDAVALAMRPARPRERHVCTCAQPRPV